MTDIFNEQSLRHDIVSTWGESGAHAEVLDLMANRIKALEEALAPFAAFAAEKSTRGAREDWPLWALNDTVMTMADIRRAAKLLGKS